MGQHTHCGFTWAIVVDHPQTWRQLTHTRQQWCAAGFAAEHQQTQRQDLDRLRRGGQQAAEMAGHDLQHGDGTSLNEGGETLGIGHLLGAGQAQPPTTA